MHRVYLPKIDGCDWQLRFLCYIVGFLTIRPSQPSPCVCMVFDVSPKIPHGKTVEMKIGETDPPTQTSRWKSPDNQQKTPEPTCPHITVEKEKHVTPIRSFHDHFLHGAPSVSGWACHRSFVLASGVPSSAPRSARRHQQKWIMHVAETTVGILDNKKIIKDLIHGENYMLKTSLMSISQYME